MRPGRLRRPSRPLAALLAFGFAVAALAPPTVRAEDAGLRERTAARIHRALTRALERLAGAASRSERVDLELTGTRRDPHQRMLFRLEGTVRVRVPGEARRARLAEALAKGEGRTFTANGPLSYDLTLVPVEIRGEEVLFDCALDLVLVTDLLLQTLIRNAASLLAALGMGVVAEQAAEALESFDAETAGRAMSLAVKELPAMLAGEGAAIAYAGLRDPEHRSMRRLLKRHLTPKGVLKHFLLAVAFLGASKVVKAGVGSLGLAAGAVLLPAGSPFVAGLLATGVWMFLGHRAVKAVLIKAPFYLRMARVRRLYAKLRKVGAEQHPRLKAKIEGILESLIERFQKEMDSSYKRWDYLQLISGYLRKRVKDRIEAGETPLDLTPFGPFLQVIDHRLKAEAMQEEGWYAARFHAQFREAIGG